MISSSKIPKKANLSLAIKKVIAKAQNKEKQSKINHTSKRTWGIFNILNNLQKQSFTVSCTHQQVEDTLIGTSWKLKK